MKWYSSFLMVALLAFSMQGHSQDVLARPNPPRLVNDHANVLSSDEISRLERKLVAYDDSTSNQIAIVIIQSLGGYPVEDYANTLYRKWGIGNKKTNNGVLILVSVDEHKIRIEVGYGLEGAIPDVTASHIIRDDLTPNFRNNNYYEGLNSAAESIIKAATGEYKAPEGYNKRKGKGGKSILGMIIAFIVIIIILSNIGRRGGGGGGMMSRRGYGNVAESIFWGSLLSGLGRGGGGGGGGGWSGGGGGFGGFGGGSSGGGGASGSW